MRVTEYTSVRKMSNKAAHKLTRHVKNLKCKGFCDIAGSSAILLLPGLKEYFESFCKGSYTNCNINRMTFIAWGQWGLKKKQEEKIKQQWRKAGQN